MENGNTEFSPLTIHTWILRNTAKLKGADIESARLDCLIMLENVLERDRTWLAAHGNETISKQKLDKLNGFITQRQKRIPLAYILSSKEFYGRDFYVNEDVLIPRPESETMIEMAKRLAESRDINTIIDIGTGSGCLAITVKKELPDVHVTGIDISDAALVVARKNGRLHEVQIQWKKIDITKGLPKMAKTRPYVLLANLPYVPKGMITSNEITREPGVALFSGMDGMDHYRKFWHQVGIIQNQPLAIITECLIEQQLAMTDLARSIGYEPILSENLVQLWSKTGEPHLV